MRGRPVSDEEIAEIRRLHADGQSLGAISRAMGRHRSVVSRACERMGLTFDRSKTAAAVLANQIDAAARREAQRTKYLDIVDEIQARMQDEYEHKQPAGADGKVRRWTTARPPARELADLMRSATAASIAELRMADHAAKDSHDDARDLVLQFGIAVRAAQLPDDEPAADG